MENQISHGRIKSVNNVTITLNRTSAGYYNNNVELTFGLSPVRAGGGNFATIKPYIESHARASLGMSAGTGTKTYSGTELCQVLYDFFTSDAQAIALYNNDTGKSGGYPFSANYTKIDVATMDVDITYLPN